MRISKKVLERQFFVGHDIGLLKSQGDCPV